MRVVRHIQHQGGLARHDLKTPGQLDHGQTVAHGLGGDRQLLAQGRQRGQHTGSVHQLVGTAQGGVSQASVAPPAAGPGPLELVAGKIEIMAKKPQISAQVLRRLQHALRRHRVAHHDRATGTHHACFLKAYGFAVVTQKLHMV
jgi:hypothetical protein